MSIGVAELLATVDLGPDVIPCEGATSATVCSRPAKFILTAACGMSGPWLMCAPCVAESVHLITAMLPNRCGNCGTRPCLIGPGQHIAIEDL